MRIIHLSDTQLSGAVIRLSTLLAKYGGVESRHICWMDKIGYREYESDIVGYKACKETMIYLIYDWADVIVYHNRWKRQEVFQVLKMEPPKKPSMIQIHSPRESEDFREEEESGLPLAIVAQYHVRQWPELTYIVPNVVDIYHKDYTPRLQKTTTSSSKDYLARMRVMDKKLPIALPVVSYAPSNTNSTGWDDKGYNIIAPVLKRLKMDHALSYQLIQQRPFKDVMALKKEADIGIDEIVTGSYHLSALEYLSLGVPCFTNIDKHTEKVVKDLTGSLSLPFLKANKDSFERMLIDILKEKSWPELGRKSRAWMESYWNPEFLCNHYKKIFEGL